MLQVVVAVAVNEESVNSLNEWGTSPECWDGEEKKGSLSRRNLWKRASCASRIPGRIQTLGLDSTRLALNSSHPLAGTTVMS